MFDYLRGTITHKDPESITLETNGMGFRLLLPGFVDIGSPLSIGMEATFHVTLVANLDRPGQPFTLIGFRNARQREFFETFMSVGGIGPKGAAKALSSPMEAIASAIEAGDTKVLRTLPGVGPGKAKKIIAELQGKMTPYGALPSAAPGEDFGGVAVPMESSFLQQVQTALEGLGYTGGEIRDQVRRVLSAHPDIDTAEEFLQKVFEG